MEDTYVPEAELFIAGALSLGLTACDAGTGPESGVDVALSFAVAPRGGLASLSPARSATPTLTHGGATLELTMVELQLDEVVLELADGEGSGDSDGDSEAASDSDGPANQKFRLGTTTVALPLGGGVITPFTDPLPAGLYEELELDIGAIHLVGAINGRPFDVTVPVNVELEMEFEPPMEIAESAEPFNITVSVDPLAWLVNDDGSFIDLSEIADNANS